MNGTDFSILFLEYLGIAVLAIAVLCALVILYVSTVFKFFEKLGFHGWLGLVPFLNVYLLFARVKMKKLYIPALAVLFAFAVLLGVIVAYPDPALLLIIAFCPTALALFLIRFKMYRSICRGFERSAFFAILVTLLPILFLPFIAFSNDQYFEKTY